MSNSIFLIHGYLANPESHWFPWLKTELQNKNKNLIIKPLTNSDNPEYPVWKQDIAQILKDLKIGDSVICHSLGCISTLDVLKDYEGPKLNKLVLVAGFIDQLKAFSGLDNFINQCEIDLNKIKEKFEKIIVFVSSNDVVVEPILTEKLAHQLGAELITEQNAGHFLDSDGYTQFDSLLKVFQTEKV